MPIDLLWNSVTMPDGCELFEERARGSSRVRGYAGRLGGALADGGGYDKRTIRVRLEMSGQSITDARRLVDDWQSAVGHEFGWLRQQSATMDRRIRCKPSDLDVAYPQTIFDWVKIEQEFVAPDPRWQSVVSTRGYIIPEGTHASRWLEGSARLSVTGSAEALTTLWYSPHWAAVTENVTAIEVTNRFANLIYNADFALQERTLSTTQQGLADNWQAGVTTYAATMYRPWLTGEEDARQHVEIQAFPAAPREWSTYQLIRYAPVRNIASPTTDTLLWGADVGLDHLVGDWRFFLRLRALDAFASTGTVLYTATSPIYGTTGAAVTVAGTSASAQITATMTVTGGLSPAVRALQAEFVFVSATGAGSPGGGNVHLQHPYLRTDGVSQYDYRPHRTIRFEGMAIYGPRLQSDLSERSALLYQQKTAAINALQYAADDSEWFELWPGSNEVHVRLTGTNLISVTTVATGPPAATYVHPCSVQNVTYIDWTDRWWA